MATGTRLMQEISDQFLHCKICFENFREPKTLSCLHTFCCDCLQQQYDSEVSSRSSRFAVYSRAIACPLCRKKTDMPAGGVRRLPDNILVCNLTNVLAKKTAAIVPPCEICPSVQGKIKEACSRCLDCNKALCKSCVDMHTSTKVTQQHSLIDLEGEKNIECKIHPEENIRFYCEPCECCICVVCTFQEHKDHDVCSLTDGFNRHKSNLDELLIRSKTRMSVVTDRLQRIKSYDMAVTGVRENIRDLTISCISKIRSRERELLKKLEENYGEKIQELREKKPVLEENLEELQNACNLIDIMLNDKGVGLLLLKKDLQSKMSHLLGLSLPEIPEKKDYEVTFIPGETVLGSLKFSNENVIKNNDDLTSQENCKESKLCKLKSSIDPDLISNCTQTDGCFMQEVSTSMAADMRIAFSNTNSQTDLTNTAIDELYLRRKEKVSSQTSNIADVTGQSQTSENTPPPDLLPANSFSYTPGRWIRSRKIQTDICNLDFTREMSDREFVHALLVLDSYHDPHKTQATKQLREKGSNEKERPQRRLSNASTMTTQEIGNGLASGEMENRKQKSGCKDAGVNAVCELGVMNTQTPIKTLKDSTSLTDAVCLEEKWTSMISLKLVDRETATPRINYEEKSTYTDSVPTSDRATITIGPKTHHKAIGTSPVNAVHMAVQVIPQSHNVSSNTPSIDIKEKNVQTYVELVDNGTVPDLNIERLYSTPNITESSVDVLIKPEVQTKSEPHSTCDRGCDALKIPLVSKSTGTTQVKMISTSSETMMPKYVDRDTGTNSIKTLDNWTETYSPQLISTGVTPPRPATIDVGVATIVIDTNDEATCTEVKSYRSVQSETVHVVCDNETMTDQPSLADAQTSVNISTETAETEADLIGIHGVASETTDDSHGSDPAVTHESHETQCDMLVLETRETDTSTRRRASKEVQTDFVGCEVCADNVASLEQTNKENPVSRLLPISRGFEGVSYKNRDNINRQEADATVISCALYDYDHQQETGVQTTSPVQLEKASATSLDFDQDFLAGALSREYQDAATSTESLPYIGLLSEIDVDELIVIPECAFELVSDSGSDAGNDVVEMVDSETCTDHTQYVETGTQTCVVDNAGVSTSRVIDIDEVSSGTRAGGYSSGVVQLVTQGEGQGSPQCNNVGDGAHMKYLSLDSTTSKHLVGIGVNTDPKVTFEKETCTPMRHLFSKGTMTFFVTKLDKATSTLAPSKTSDGSKPCLHGRVKTESVDKITMTSRAEHKDIGVVTERADIDGRIEDCISKLRNVSQKLNSPTSRKPNEVSFFEKDTRCSDTNKTSKESPSTACISAETSFMSSNETQFVGIGLGEKQDKNLTEMPVSPTNDKSSVRKPQPITTLKGRKPFSLQPSQDNTSIEPLYPAKDCYDSKSLPRQFVLNRQRPVKMGSQPLNSSRLPLLRYNSAPEQMTTVPPHMISTRPMGIMGPKNNSSSPPPRTSPSKIPITKKQCLYDEITNETLNENSSGQSKKKACAPDDIWIKKPSTPPIDVYIDEESQNARPKLRRPLPSITETRTPSLCSETSTISFMSANSTSSAVDSASSSSMTAKNPKKTCPSLDTSKTEDNKSATQTPSTSTTMSSSMVMSTSESLTDSVFKKSSTETIPSSGSTDILEETATSTPSTSHKKSGIGFMQRILGKRKKNSEPKKHQPAPAKSGPSTGAAEKVQAVTQMVPQGPVPDPQACGTNQYRAPHHYTPRIEPKIPEAHRKSRPFVYVRQRIFSIQQDNVEEASERKTKEEDGSPKKASSSVSGSHPSRGKESSALVKNKFDVSPARAAEKQRPNAKSKDENVNKTQKVPAVTDRWLKRHNKDVGGAAGCLTDL